MPQLSDGLIQVLQVGTILLLSPLVTGAIARVEAIVQMRRGPRLLQPYYDIAKLFRKETVLPEGAGPVFRVAPYVAFACYCIVPLLIPVLTSFPPQGSYHGRHPRRRLPPRPGELRRLAGGDRQRQPLRAARLEPAAHVRGARRADDPVRRLHGRADHAHRPAVRLRGDPEVVGGGDRPALRTCSPRPRSSWSCSPRPGGSRSRATEQPSSSG